MYDSIGITSGRAFCGTAGGDVRCEYTLHGTLVNLAARLMSAASKLQSEHSVTNTIMNEGLPGDQYNVQSNIINSQYYSEEERGSGAGGGAILVNESTWEETQLGIIYEAKRMIKVKGKANEVAVSISLSVSPYRYVCHG